MRCGHGLRSSLNGSHRRGARSTIGAALVASIVLASIAPGSSAVAAASLSAKQRADNGGFEQPTVPPGGFLLFAPGQKFGGWRTVGAVGNVGIVDRRYTSFGIRFPARAGSQWLDLTGLSNSKTGVAQTAKTVRGAHYRLSFYVGNVVNPGGIYGTSSSVAVKISGRHVRTVTNSLGTGQSVIVWKRYAIAFKATSRHTVLKFLNRDPASDNSNGLDVVRLVRTAA